MARGRMLSKDISLDEKVDALSDDTARLLFTWMIPHLDREGRMYGDPQIFKSIVAPRRNYRITKIQKSLNEMEKLGLIERYFIGKNQYIFAPNFEKHQIGLRKERETASKIPPKPIDLGRNKDGVKTELVLPKLKRNLKEIKENNSSNNIFSLYEQEIGQLTQMISEELIEAEKLFGAEMIKDAIKEAVRANKRNWRYIAGILENWAKTGKGKRGTDPNKFFKGKYGDSVCRTQEDIAQIKEIRG